MQGIKLVGGAINPSVLVACSYHGSCIQLYQQKIETSFPCSNRQLGLESLRVKLCEVRPHVIQLEQVDVLNHKWQIEKFLVLSLQFVNKQVVHLINTIRYFQKQLHTCISKSHLQIRGLLY
jgi:hypothetical protein